MRPIFLDAVHIWLLQGGHADEQKNDYDDNEEEEGGLQGVNHDYFQWGQRQWAPGEQTWGVQADRGPRGPADLQEWGEGRVSFLSQGEPILKL